jgi:hypothetical protein
MIFNIGTNSTARQFLLPQYGYGLRCPRCNKNHTVSDFPCLQHFFATSITAARNFRHNKFQPRIFGKDLYPFNSAVIIMYGALLAQPKHWSPSCRKMPISFKAVFNMYTYYTAYCLQHIEFFVTHLLFFFKIMRGPYCSMLPNVGRKRT